MRFRLLTAAALAALAVVGLTACDSKVGQAAVVGGHRISEHEVSDYVTRQGPSAAALSTTTGTFNPRVQVLNELVNEAVFEQMIESLGRTIPSDSVLASKYGARVAQQFGPTAQLVQKVKSLGLQGSFAHLLIRTSELSLIVTQGITTQAQFDSLLAKYEPTVTVSSRYGVWHPKQLTIKDTGNAGTPGFVKLLPTTAPAQ